MKNKRTNYQISSSIRNDKIRLKKINEQIKNKIIYKKKIETRIDSNVDDLTSRFQKKGKINLKKL